MAIELDNSFTVPVPPDVAWDVLLDVARIAPCMPGATVDEVDGDVVNGRIKVKVGPVSLTYKGTATFTERNDDARTVAVEASGKETRGAGTASAVVTASLAPADGDGTLVTMHTTMNITGRPAQFGRGVMVEISGKLVDQFASNLALQLAGDGGASAPAPTSAGAADSSEADAAGADAAGQGVDAKADVAAGGAGAKAGAAAVGDNEPAEVTSTPPAPAHEESLNLIRLVGPAILKRVIPAAAIAAVVALLGRRIRRGFRRGFRRSKQ
jgi:uncharacterized protein